MQTPGAALRIRCKAALLALFLTLPGCGHLQPPKGVHFAVTLRMRYGPTMLDDRWEWDYSLGLNPEDMHNFWLRELEAFMRHGHKPVAGPSQAR